MNKRNVSELIIHNSTDANTCSHEPEHYQDTPNGSYYLRCRICHVPMIAWSIKQNPDTWEDSENAR